MTKRTAQLRSLKKKVSQGNLKALYQLHEQLRLGIECEKDLKEAEKLYFKGVSALSFNLEPDGIERPINPFRIDQLQLYCFKQFEELRLKFHSNITVLIGDNGTGKSTIIDAIAKIFSIVNNRIVGKGRTGKKIEFWEVKIGSKEAAEIIATFKLGDRTYFNGSLVRSPKGITSPKSTDLKELSEYSNMIRDFNTYLTSGSGKELNIPLLALYSVERTTIKTKHSFNLEFSPESGLESRFDAIDKSVLDGTGNLNEFLEWFIKLDNLANAVGSIEFKELEVQIAALEETVTGEQHPLFQLLQNLKLEYSRIESVNSADVSVSQKYKSYLNTVKKAIKGVFSDLEDIWVDRSSGSAEVKLDLSGSKINIFQSSKGQQILFSLVSDIARRLVLLNPTLNDPLFGQGVLLIDEVELHLHPKWQQEILENLHKTFPNIQFIFTTHSPLVLSTVDVNSVVKLNLNNENESYLSYPTFQTKGVTSADILAEIMDVNSVPNVKEAKDLTTALKLIESNKSNSEEFKLLYSRLIAHFGESHPVIQRCENQIKLQTLKKRAKERAIENRSQKK